ncbi:MAG: undecaprenyl/decaprenyl-phosphate alpha-N-acetylglucosaminyl 1-phosphate transferase [Yaniella sp.]|uniref:MraY family glycosyltransferase n=1 Tax=Yaniella sp. TaxID=2773929 RepID=UPI002649AE6F|nr:MraY family glycosyltransferase [Yaniella sp.]MDN5731153.1 undecaprenyl/decaprenyl-phosphate alpha-N-acetylglucosaminyl 1-phosphate transferase [Yaniella sp.]MDN5742785.1 undecaprenyl/decaprenyl-phosphate alpha-N-acetylglucosaminyl 1-phosphate transferase [Yaniella sp.]MDN5815482.1 undecaprenyl/decaprenyl-phosphate alpha-N-acetylglucosaminyl 1-phosphate transferase [Yaniella sp.]MDN5817350.1 undecaprenyl/decaprenyl-phosphate alpha-N-acetylglucosaminyl 1-phosphate transferase [Yaniella sp.]M
MKVYLAVVAITALLSFALTPVARMLGVRGRVYTPSRKRDMHREPIPKLGGAAMAIAVVIAMGLSSLVPFLSGIYQAPIRGILGAILIILIMGVADDLWDLHWIVKFAGQVVAAGIVAAAGIRVEAMPVGWIHVDNEIAQILITIFVIVLTINAFNFIDGLDGLAAGVAVIGGSAFFLYSYVLTRTINAYDYSNLSTLLTALLIGACIGFLPFNFHPAKIFMGEVGAQLIGLLMATAAVAVTADLGALEGFRFRNVPAYMPILLPLAVMLLPLLDLVMAVLRRTARRSSPFTADRGHIHHKLVDGGYTHRQAVLLLYLWTFVIGYGAVSLTYFSAEVVFAVVAIAMALLVLLTLRPWIIRRAYYRKLNSLRAARAAQRATEDPSEHGEHHG